MLEVAGTAVMMVISLGDIKIDVELMTQVFASLAKNPNSSAVSTKRSMASLVTAAVSRPLSISRCH